MKDLKIKSRPKKQNIYQRKTRDLFLSVISPGDLISQLLHEQIDVFVHLKAVKVVGIPLKAHQQATV